jgi:hypothetical protein
MTDDKLYVAFPENEIPEDGEVPEKFQDALDWDRDDIEIISVEEAKDAIP